jgi:hypothetical protein
MIKYVLALASVLVRFYLQSNSLISVYYFVYWNISVHIIKLYIKYYKAEIAKKYLLEIQSSLDAIIFKQKC